MGDRFFIMATCAHNFMQFKDKGDGKGSLPMHASLDGSSFYLQREGDEFKCEMRVIQVSVHPDFVEDGNNKDIQFKNGTDIAFAVVEIP